MHIKLFSSIKKLNLALSVVLTLTIGFTMTDITLALAQLNNNNSRNNSMASISTSMKSDADGKHIVITWLEANETTHDNSPIISVTSQEFWQAFSPLLEISTNRTIANSE